MANSSQPKFEAVIYEVTGPVATITLDRPEMANAQNTQLIDEVDAAFDLADADDQVRVVVLAGRGRHFSSGHDLKALVGDTEPDEWRLMRETPEGKYHHEKVMYFDRCLRIRDFRKPTIAAVQGKCIAAGVMLACMCDLIVASDDATFADPVVAFGVNGVEYFAHPWEVGPRKAKEMLFTGEPLTAAEAKTLGMVNRVVSAERLESYTLEMASHIAKRPSMGLKLAKQSVNQMQDAQGLWPSLQAAMSLQQLGHSHNAQVHKIPVDPAGLRIIRDQAKAGRKFEE